MLILFAKELCQWFFLKNLNSFIEFSELRDFNLLIRILSEDKLIWINGLCCQSSVIASEFLVEVNLQYLSCFDHEPLHSSHVKVPSEYINKSDQSPHSSQYPEIADAALPISPLIIAAFSDTTSTNSGVTAITSELEMIPANLSL